jgi:hypothetical protein
MNAIEQARKEGRGYYTWATDENLKFNRRGLNARTALLLVGEEGDLTAPVAGIVQINAGPGDPLRGRHLHRGDAINLVIDGGLCMDGTWLRPGQAKIVPANLTYGDAITAKDGCLFLEIFLSGLHAKPFFHNPRDQAYFEEVHGDLGPATFGGIELEDPPEDARSPIERNIRTAKFDELDETWVQTGGLSTRFVFIGPENHPNSPIGIAIKGDGNVADFVAGKRSFDTTTLMVVLGGTVMHDGKWLSLGDMYVSPPNEMSGDLVFGPDGGVIFIMFNKRSGIIPKFSDANDQANFDRLLRKDVEEIAAGKIEKSVPLLPLRDHSMVGRAIVYETVQAVEDYRAKTGTDW